MTALIFSVLIFIYAFFTLLLIIFWVKIPRLNKKQRSYSYNHKISIIISARNEEENILVLLQSLSKQTYQNFEVILIDDASTDNTANIIQNFEANFLLTLLQRTSEERGQSPKKEAISLGISKAKGSWIVTTDADCEVPQNWLRDIVHVIHTQKVKLISALVSFHKEKSFFEKLQTIEFASLVGSGAVSMYLNAPNMCNGANLSYEKKTFYEVGGFEGIAHIASGDDELLLQKIAQKYPKQIYFLKSKTTIVRTKAQKTIRDFYQQRKRWASKWKFYKDLRSKFLAVFIFLINFGLILGFTLCFLGKYSLKMLLIQIFTKFGIEIVYLTLVLQYLGKTRFIILIPILQILYPFYVVFFGVMANISKGYEWKNTKLK